MPEHPRKPGGQPYGGQGCHGGYGGSGKSGPGNPAGGRPGPAGPHDGGALPTARPPLPFHLPLPVDTMAALGRSGREALQQSDNLGLLFQRYAAIWADPGCSKTEVTLEWLEQGKRKSKAFNLKHEFLKEVERLSKRLAKPTAALGALLQSLNERRWLLIEELGAAGCSLISFERTLEAPLVTGLGSGHPSEAGFTFHPLYGVPCLAASGLKGLARSAATIVTGLEPQRIRELFGSPDKNEMSAKQFQRGRVMFFDAFPKRWTGMKVDIMNPHYPDYYQGQAAPTEWQSPRPVTFATVPAGTCFDFLLAVPADAGLDGDAKTAILAEARKSLVSGLSDLGFGGKTAAGYGLFESAPDYWSDEAWE